jgi:tetratricopeptide (TPR) repeat protein
MQAGNYEQALTLLTAAETYPPNLGEGKLYGVPENDIFYLKGQAYQALRDVQLARTYFERATQGLSEPVQAVFYNDPQPDTIFYQGLAWRALNQPERAELLFRRLIQFGEAHLNDTIRIDYFAVSLPDLLVFDADLNERNRIHCYYLIGLGYLGLGSAYARQALDAFDRVLQLDRNHQGAALHRKGVNQAAVVSIL